ncbi:MAG: orotidine-5'-phosphate decarboxylase [Candidatus Aegiribacteria sp.]|nr:orotidine-5'-phosphate decarboxylase [Candidatus Aegiribacteria sp.]
MSETRLYIAITSREMENRKVFFEKLKGLQVGMKVGLELFVREGPPFVRQISEAGFPLFLDLKFHDIPFTVDGAVRSACGLKPELINIHASGGAAMMKAAAEAVEGNTKILAVTVLTSLSRDDLSFLGFNDSPMELVTKMAVSAKDAGLAGVVCSPVEAAAVREAAGPEFLIVTPGIRPAGAPSNDQKRVATPTEAILAGATSLVVGRPVTQVDNPRKAVISILDEIAQALDKQ